MADTVLLSRNFDLGFQRDDARDQLARGAAYDMVDFIPRLGSPLRKRGGWGLGSKDLNSLFGSARLNALAWAPFSSSPHLIMVSDTHGLFKTTGAIDSVSGSLVGDCSVVPTYAPFWHQSTAGDRMILPVGMDQGGLIDPRKYDGTVVAAIPNSPPRARSGWSWGDYLILANGYDPSSAYALRENRIWVSNVADPDTFNTTSSGGIWDMPAAVVGGLSLRTTIVVFGYSSTWVLLGDTPPPGGNWERRDLFPALGCFDGRSIATWRDYFIWANHSGIYRSDGATLSDLTEAAGISTYWRSLVGDAANGFSTTNGWKAAGGVLFGHYVITITNGAGTNVATIAINLSEPSAFRIANLKTMMFAQRVSGPGTATESGREELFAAWYGGPRAIRLSGLWTPSSANANDGDGVAVLPVLETPYYKLSATEEKRIRNVYVNYDLRSAGGNPKLAVGHVLSPEDTAYVESSYQLPVTTKLSRKPVDIRKRSIGFALRIRQTDASADTRISELEAEGRLGEGSR